MGVVKGCTRIFGPVFSPYHPVKNREVDRYLPMVPSQVNTGGVVTELFSDHHTVAQRKISAIAHFNRRDVNHSHAHQAASTLHANVVVDADLLDSFARQAEENAAGNVPVHVDAFPIDIDGADMMVVNTVRIAAFADARKERQYLIGTAFAKHFVSVYLRSVAIQVVNGALGNHRNLRQSGAVGLHSDGRQRHVVPYVHCG